MINIDSLLISKFIPCETQFLGVEYCFCKMAVHHFEKFLREKKKGKIVTRYGSLIPTQNNTYLKVYVIGDCEFILVEMKSSSLSENDDGDVIIHSYEVHNSFTISECNDIVAYHCNTAQCLQN